jgi:hypothetical protein
MSVELALDIQATSQNGNGAIHVDVAATNNGSQPVEGGPASFMFSLFDQNGCTVPGLTQTSMEPQYVQSVQPGGTFGGGWDFTVSLLDGGSMYTLACSFPPTQDESTQTFTFDPVEQPVTPQPQTA